MSSASKSDTTSFDDIDLMLYVDGEVDEATAAEIAAFLESDQEASAKAESLRQMDDVLASYLELAADEQEPRLDAMWATIERQIGTNGVMSSPAPAEARSPATVSQRHRHRHTTAPVRGGLWASINGWLEGYRGHILTGAAAMAAAALLVMALQPGPTVVVQGAGSSQGSDPIQVKAPVNQSPQPAVKSAVTEPPAVEHLDVPDGSGSVFVMPSDDEDDVSATVIFIDMNQVEGPL